MRKEDDKMNKVDNFINVVINIYNKLPCLLKHSIIALFIVAGTILCLLFEILIVDSSLFLLCSFFLRLNIVLPSSVQLISRSIQVITTLSIIEWLFIMIAYKINSTIKQITHEIPKEYFVQVSQKSKGFYKKTKNELRSKIVLIKEKITERCK